MINAKSSVVFNNPLLLKKRKFDKLFETERSNREYACEIESTNDATKKIDKYENQGSIYGIISIIKNRI